jgi:hypothetical protein
MGETMSLPFNIGLIMIDNSRIYILDIPLVFVKENKLTLPYVRSYTLSGLPYYISPKDKNILNGLKLMEYLFLPITTEDFLKNKEDYFIGYRILIYDSNYNTLGLVNSDKEDGITRYQIQYELSRIRYAPEDEKSIEIDHMYDPMFPTQTINDKVNSSEVEAKVIDTIQKTIDFYCNYYLNKRV